MEGREEKQKVGRQCGTLIEWSDREEVGRKQWKRKRGKGKRREDVFKIARLVSEIGRASCRERVSSPV